MACQIMDWAIQMHGGGGVTSDFGLAKMYATARTMRIVDGPDEVHRVANGPAGIGQIQARPAQHGGRVT